MKKPYQSKTIIFFVVMLIGVVATGLTKDGDVGSEFQNINWEAVIVATGGIIMRFLSHSKVKL